MGLACPRFRDAQAWPMFAGLAPSRPSNSMSRSTGYLSSLRPRLYEFFLNRGILRPLGNVVYILPPYAITPAQLASIYDAIEDSLSLLPE